jgi:hypothetical protein
MRPQATSVCGLKLLVYTALSYYLSLLLSLSLATSITSSHFKFSLCFFCSLSLSERVYMYGVCVCVCVCACVGYTAFTTCNAAIPGSVVGSAVLSLLFFSCLLNQSTTFLRTWAHACTASARARVHTLSQI